ncbi:MAG: hypothetical protein LC808_28440 [Actinobacteria bacterium]|nr:hypothetical protein [Actinomycetota bacterium]
MFEASGLSTVQISLLREHTEKVRPPRALFCPFPFGLALGKPNDPEFQHRVLAQTFSLLERPSGPVLEDFPEEIVPADAPLAPAEERPPDPAFELTALRGYYDRFVEQYGRTAVGLTGVPSTRFRGLVRLLERYAAGEEIAVPTPDLSAAQYARFACDDLKAFFREARIQQYPTEDGPRIDAWFWQQTAMGALMRRVRDRMLASGDPDVEMLSYGIYREPDTPNPEWKYLPPTAAEPLTE